MFKSTIKKFENNSSYNLILKQEMGHCNSKYVEACTDASDIANGNITIYFQGTGNNNLDFAATILHEGIHAELYKYVDEHKKGIDPNNRKRLLELYFFYKKNTEPYLADIHAQHQYMAEKYVKPIAQAIRKLDNYKYPLKHYMGFGWDGLRGYGVNLDKATNSDYYKKQKIVNDNSQFNKKICK